MCCGVWQFFQSSTAEAARTAAEARTQGGQKSVAGYSPPKARELRKRDKKSTSSWLQSRRDVFASKDRLIWTRGSCGSYRVEDNLGPELDWLPDAATDDQGRGRCAN